MSKVDQAMQLSNYTNLASLQRVRFIVSKMADNIPQDVLEVGCGYGDVCFPLLSLGHMVTGIDINPVAVKMCRDRNTYHGKFWVANAQYFDMKHEYDVIICSEVIEHVKEPGLVLDQIVKHCKPGTRLIFSVPNGWCLREIAVNRLGAGKLMGYINKSQLLLKTLSLVKISMDFNYFENQYQQHVNYWTLRQFRELLVKHGIEIHGVQNLGLGLSLWTLDKLIAPLVRLEYTVDKYTPHVFAGGWLLECSLR